MPRGGVRAVGVACAAVVLLLVAARPVAGQERDISKQFMRAWQRATDLYNLGEYDEARKVFERAAKFEPELPGPYRYLAAIASNQERYEDCLVLARKAVELNPESKWFDEVRTLHEGCRDSLGRPGLDDDLDGGGAVWVSTEPTGARIELNGLAYGATPMRPRSFAPGPATVSVQLEDYLPAEREVEIVPGLVTDVVFELEPDPDAQRVREEEEQEEVEVGWLTVRSKTPRTEIIVDGEPAERDARGRVEADPGEYEVVLRAPEHEPWRRRVRISRGQEKVVEIALRDQADVEATRRKGFIALGAAGALATAGAVFALLERDAREEANDIWDTETARPSGQPLDVTGMIEPVRTREDLADARDRGQRYRLLSLVSLGAAAVAAGAGVYYFIDSRRPDREGFPAPLALTPLVPGDERGVGATVTYRTEIDW